MHERSPASPVLDGRRAERAPLDGLSGLARAPRASSGPWLVLGRRLIQPVLRRALTHLVARSGAETSCRASPGQLAESAGPSSAAWAETLPALLPREGREALEARPASGASSPGPALLAREAFEARFEFSPAPPPRSARPSKSTAQAAPEKLFLVSRFVNSAKSRTPSPSASKHSSSSLASVCRRAHTAPRCGQSTTPSIICIRPSMEITPAPSLSRARKTCKHKSWRNSSFRSKAAAKNSLYSTFPLPSTSIA
mmetsp:Transcript_94164/g.255672  ORF Transcript_94164/g.255672 Transcript_94164/m.255672 type:complete len:254 (-) Transcript_94164:1358-2119(-)